MSRYHGEKRHSSRSDRDAVFPLFIILACLAYTHKSLTLKAEHLIPTVLIIVIGVISLTIAIKVIFRILKYFKRNNPNMAAIDNMTGLEFEHYVVGLLKSLGYNHVRLTEKYDYGIDIIAIKDGITWGIQVKRYSGLVKANAVRQVVTALKKYHCDRAMVVTNSSKFSQVAEELARANDCVLIDRDSLLRGHPQL